MIVSVNYTCLSLFLYEVVQPQEAEEQKACQHNPKDNHIREPVSLRSEAKQ